MADNAPETVGGGGKQYLGTLAFIFPLVGVEEAVRRAIIILVNGSVEPGTLVAPWWLSVGLILIGYPLHIAPAIWKRLRRKNASSVAPLRYLPNEDTELGPAIFRMTRHSAISRWYAAQALALSGVPITEDELLRHADHIVMEQMRDGNLVVRGRKPGSLEYEVVPRTHWRSSALHFVPDKFSLWKMLVIPVGGTVFQDGKILETTDVAATQRTESLQTYDSLLVDSRQFESLWPQKDAEADRARKKFIQTAKTNGADTAEIQRLSR